MRNDLDELIKTVQSFEESQHSRAEQDAKFQPRIPDLSAAIYNATAPARDTRRSAESLEALVQQVADLLNNQQKQIDENNASGKKSTRLAWIAIIVSVAMTILSIGASVLISIYL